ncbi:MAG: hypothetical protein Q9164_000394 [Protoblastenia rupestris]
MAEDAKPLRVLIIGADLLDTCLPPEIRARIQSAETDPKYVASPESVMPAYHAVTGELLKNFPAPWSRRLRRKKFMEILGTDIDIREDGQSVTLHFEDGTRETGDLLIGAEGAHSLTREYLLGKDAAQLLPLDYVASYALTTLGKESTLALRRLHPRYTAQVHPDGVYAFIAVHDTSSEDPAQWTWLLTQTWRSPEPTNLKGAAVLADMKERAKSFASPWRGAYLNMPDGTPAWHSRMANWPTKPWDSKGGKITLIGDAAHPMTIHRGQGLQNGIMDAFCLLQHVREMKESTKEELGLAVGKYEKEMWPRGAEAVLDSQENTRLLHDWNTIFESPLFRGAMAQNVGKA